MGALGGARRRCVSWMGLVRNRFAVEGFCAQTRPHRFQLLKPHVPKANDIEGGMVSLKIIFRDYGVSNVEMMIMGFRV